MERILGLETEYGITVTGEDSVDVVHESIELVRSYTELAASARAAAFKWDYGREDPHRDARGFRVGSLLQDVDESEYFAQDRNRPLSYEEIKSDLVLSNGARFYNDHAHPEYATPECRSLFDLVAHDKAGERIVAECVRWRNRDGADDQRIKVYKNNTDFSGHSYGCHDNYLMARSVPFETVIGCLTPFLVTRQVFAGAGKVGVELEEQDRAGGYQLSQRADFFMVPVSIDTMNRRPIINTRDEPHADPDRFRRLHVIVGDANMSEHATALKLGTTALILSLIERGVCPPEFALADPVTALKIISRDPSLQAVVRRERGGTIRALDIQAGYLAAAEQHLAGSTPEVDWVLDAWRAVLEDLAADPYRCADRVDWVAKRDLLETFREAERLDWSDPWLAALDLEYHNIDPADGLYHELVRAGRVRRMVDDDRVSDAVRQAPPDTRAYFRGECVRRFGTAIEAVQWDEIKLRAGDGVRVVSMMDVFDEATVRHYNAAIDDAADVAMLLRSLAG